MGWEQHEPLGTARAPWSTLETARINDSITQRMVLHRKLPRCEVCRSAPSEPGCSPTCTAAVQVTKPARSDWGSSVQVAMLIYLWAMSSAGHRRVQQPLRIT